MSEKKSQAKPQQPSMRRQSSFHETMTELLVRKDQLPQGNRKTKIIATIGPASWDVDTLSKLLEAGANVFRLNFSHGNHETHARTVKRIREASAKTGIVCGIMLDTKGPEIRTTNLKPNKDGKRVVMLEAGQTLEILCAPDNMDTFEGDSKQIAVDYANMPKVLQYDSILKIDDGLIVCKVQRCTEKSVIVTVTNTAELGTNKGVNLPGSVVDLPFLNEKDRNDILFGVEQGVDFIAASFTRNAQDLKDIRTILGDEGKHIQLIAKIESQQGVDNYDSILREADAIMVARGDLAVETSVQSVPVVQKILIRKANSAGVPVITATQMLESMVHNPRPTRAETTDVANSVFDGSSCVMLSGESAKGAYPVKSVEVMHRICLTAELAIDYENCFLSTVQFTRKPLSKAEAIASSAVRCTIDTQSPLIVCFTEHGGTARAVAKYRPPVPILTMTHHPRTARQALINFAVWPVLINNDKLTREETIEYAFKLARDNEWAKSGDSIVAVSGIRSRVSGATNTMQLLDL